MLKFLKYTFAAFIGCMIALLLVFLMFIAGMFASSPIVIQDKSILKISLDVPVSDRSAKNPMKSFDLLNLTTKSLGLNDILSNIERAAHDSKILGIYLDMSSISTNIATTEEIRVALENFKKSGKFIISYSDSYSQKAYYLATVADEVYMTPIGDFFLKGMSSQVMFYKNALDKLDIDMQIIRHGKFKSAVEPFMLESMSKENREQTTAFVGSIWNSLLTTIAQARNLPKEELTAWIDGLEIYGAKPALEKKLVDGLLYKDQVLEKLIERTGQKKIEDLRMVSLSKYIQTETPPKSKKDAKNIAVIYAQGDIVMGEGSNGITSEGMSEAIRTARLDTTVKAIVLRVNSGGGSALASDIICREVQLASEVKPVIASFGDVAASGGYYIATQANVIVADPTTITGSIGVFGMIPNIKGFLKNKLGVTSEFVNTNRHSDMETIMRPLDAEELQLIQKSVEDIYDTFITRVSTGRGMSKESVDEIGQGRVWSAVDAKRLGLVDELGGLEHAIQVAAGKANLTDYHIIELPKLPNPLETLLSTFEEDMSIKLTNEELGDAYKYYKHLKSILEMEGVQARLPYRIELN